MGKLLQKLVNKVVPSWLTKIKSSTVDTSPKKLALPYSKGSTHVSSLPSPSSSRTHHCDEPRSVFACDNPDQSKEDVDDDDDDSCAKACTGNSVTLMSPSLTKGRMSNPKPPKTSQYQDHRHQYHTDPHQPHHVDAKICSINQASMHADSCTRSGTPSRKQGVAGIHIDKHNHHPQQRPKDPSGLGKRNQCTIEVPEADNRHHEEARKGRSEVTDRELCNFLEVNREGNVCGVHGDNCHHQEARRGRGDVLLEEMCDLLELDREGVREGNVRNYPDYDYSHEAEMEEQHYKILYHDLLGLKRKSQYLQEEEEEEMGEEEPDGGGSRRSSSNDLTGWGRKRTKGERGRTSCELPESICGVVGNGRAVVKHSQNPHMALWESMVEMIVGNGLWDLGSLEFLLFCYLSLNEPHLHPIIQSSFLQALQDLEKV